MSGSWVYFPSFFQADTAGNANSTFAMSTAAMVLQAAWRRRKARELNARTELAAAAKLQRAARRHLYGSAGLRSRQRTWSLPLTTLVLERVPPAKMSWQKEATPSDSPPAFTSARAPQGRCPRATSLAAKVAIAAVSWMVVRASSCNAVVFSLDPPKLQQSPRQAASAAPAAVAGKRLDTARLPAAPPAGAGGLISPGGLISFGGSRIFGGANGSAPATGAARGDALGKVAGQPASGAWGKMHASHAGGTVTAHKTAPLSLGPVLFAPLLEDVMQATAALMRATASLVGHVRLILQAIFRRAKQVGERVGAVLGA